MFRFDPELELAGSVPSVIPHLKGSDNDRADGPGLLRLCGEGEEDGDEDAGAEECAWMPCQERIPKDIEVG